MKTPEEILESHCPSMSYLFLDKSGRLFRDRVAKAMKEYAVDMLQRYTEFLQEEGYIDTDATLEHPTAIDQFLKKDNLK